jgi:nucleoside-diphosphate-sugar epimerase
MKHLLVTGAAGVIASNPVAELNRRGHENITAVDALPALLPS